MAIPPEGSMSTEQQAWLTAAEAAAYLRVSPRTLLAWVRAGDVKGYPLHGTKQTEGSAKTFVLAHDILNRLGRWKQVSHFCEANDWIFASPFSIGRLPYSYTGTRQELVRASKASKIGHLSTHAFRHTYRSWLDAVGTPIAVQQKLMR